MSKKTIEKNLRRSLLVELKAPGVPIGICGLVKREILPDVDLGFAFLPEFWGNGYAYESAAAVLLFAGTTLSLKRVVAITSPDNHNSIKVLEKLGLQFQHPTRLSPDGPEIRLFAREL